MCQACKEASKTPPVYQALMEEVSADGLCEWCTIAQADVLWTPKEPIQLNLLQKTIVCMQLCGDCVELLGYIEEMYIYG